ncbi:MAG: Cell division protein ftsA [Parcubacteria group bacterium GW2011_GWA2_46_7]|nr:MAG: Cell division protein ftsA [Parcubacteria group bacterium GW2011_GWF1_45_5]KKU43788.1 MAG: Cell division protein ftsA [Parcubacteria group bacterium GW2011_GWA2_46_7]KKU47923.1 MAG: Cell division protein ftsA [Parcubacteria group bacterium GW2011_GWF2_46_8]OHD13906.1 MAG: cell division protein FtsA [Spirochaetes bacterium GWB1_48_6]
MNQKPFCAIDIGSFSIKGLVADINSKKGSVDIVHMAEASSHGVRRGIIFDVEDAAHAIAGVLSQCEEAAKQEINEVSVGIGGPCLETRFAKGTIIVSRPDEQIGEDDVRRVQETIHTTPGPQNRTILHVIPRYYCIDEVDRVKTSPVDMQGARLSLEATVVDLFTQASLNLSKTFAVVGVQTSVPVANILAVSKAFISKRDREQGVAVIEIGAETTSLAVFEDEELLHLAVVPLGSQNITNDIANALKIHFDTAERIKIAFGSAIEAKVNRKEEIDLSQFIEGEDEIVSRRHVAEIIEARASEILGFVNDELKKMDRAGKLPAGAYVYGGGSQLPYFTQLMKHELKLSARYLTFDQYSRYFDSHIGISYAGVCGLLVWHLDSIMGERRPMGQSGMAGWLKKFIGNFLP